LVPTCRYRPRGRNHVRINSSSCQLKLQPLERVVAVFSASWESAKRKYWEACSGSAADPPPGVAAAPDHFLENRYASSQSSIHGIRETSNPTECIRSVWFRVYSVHVDQYA
jgi:hypothetical protein